MSHLQEVDGCCCRRGRQTDTSRRTSHRTSSLRSCEGQEAHGRASYTIKVVTGRGTKTGVLPFGNTRKKMYQTTRTRYICISCHVPKNTNREIAMQPIVQDHLSCNLHTSVIRAHLTWHDITDGIVVIHHLNVSNEQKHIHGLTTGVSDRTTTCALKQKVTCTRRSVPHRRHPACRTPGPQSVEYVG